MDSILLSYILPIFGILIILFSSLSYVFPYGLKFKDRIQKINAFGVKLEISVVTFFIIVGVMFTLVGFYLNSRDYEGRLKSAEDGKLRAKAALEQAQKMEVNALVTLDNLGPSGLPKLENVKAEYYFYGSQPPVKVDVNRGYRPDQFRIVLKDINPQTLIRQLVVEDPSTNRKWVFENFLPLQPEYSLKREI